MHERTIRVEKQGNVFIVTLDSKDNRFSMEFMAQFNKVLDSIESNPERSKGAALITVSTHPKIFSNGLLLEEAFKLGKNYFNVYEKLLARILVFPMPTVACINGHAWVSF